MVQPTGEDSASDDLGVNEITTSCFGSQKMDSIIADENNPSEEKKAETGVLVDEGEDTTPPAPALGVDKDTPSSEFSKRPSLRSRLSGSSKTLINAIRSSSFKSQTDCCSSRSLFFGAEDSEDLSVRRLCSSSAGCLEARAKVAAFFEKSVLLRQAGADEDFKEVDEIPTFSTNELILGKSLGRGGFSEVEEIRGILFGGGSAISGTDSEGRPQHNPMTQRSRSDSLAVNDKESRLFIAQHVLRHSGEARYAMKKLRRDVVSDKERFWAGVVDLAIEALYLKKMSHPNIVKLRGIADSDPCDEGFFLLLDRLYDTLQTRICKWRASRCKLLSIPALLRDLRGTNLREMLEKRLAAAYDLSAAIGYLHKRRVLHRDIKPENIGFDIRGDIKIFDFGMARELLDHEAEDDGSYRLTQMTGSLRYMAPEVALGKSYNEGSDVYSFTIVLWEMLALRRPYTGFKTEQEFKSKVFEGGARPPIKGLWPKACKDLLVAGWSRMPQHRPKMETFSKVLRDEVVRLRHGDDSGLEHTRRRSTFILRKHNSSSTGATLPLTV